ncbi:MAG: hypothetical protein GXP45_05745 [bacterium]|nr:hypothetical protein [bacterium]
MVGILLLGISLWTRKRKNIKKYRFLHLLVGLILFLMILTSYNLHISIDEQNFSFSFGPGLISKEIPLDTIQSCKPVHNKRWR